MILNTVIYYDTKTSSAGLMVLVDKDMAQEYMINDESNDSDESLQ